MSHAPSRATALRVAVVGASGYGGAETVRWILGHPQMELAGVVAGRSAGKNLMDLWPSLGVDMPILAEPPQADGYFLAMPHGEAAKLAPSLSGLIVDLSGDHRLPPEVHPAWYGFDRPGPAWLYGLPELGADRYRGHRQVANPGCFATALALALLPMRGRLPAVVHATGLTGSTGSGNTPTEGTHHPTRAENLRPYKSKVFRHQHTPEVVQAVGGGFRLDFVPISAPMRRGILVSIGLDGADVADYRSFYAGNPLVRVTDTPPETLSVCGSPRADIGVLTGPDGQGLVFCAIDNLCRGAGSQAVANMNLLCGWQAHHGLRQIPAIP